MTDPGKIEELRSRLYEYVSANPHGDQAEKARQILNTLPAKAATETPGANMPHQGPKDLSDEQAGTARGPLFFHSQPGTTGSGFASERSPRDVSNAEGEMQDPIARELVGQAMTMPALHVAGLGLSAIGRKFLGTEGGQAAKFLGDKGLPFKEPPRGFGGPPADFDPAVPVRGGSFHGGASGDAVAKLEAMKASPNLPKSAAPQIDAEIARIKGDAAITPDPEVARARDALAFRAPHGMGDMGALGAALPLYEAGFHKLAALPALAKMAAKNASPLAGRLANPLLEAGAGLAPGMAPTGPTFLQAATGRE